MLGKHPIAVDEWAEVWDLLRPYADSSFWQWPPTLDPATTYIVGRVLLKENWTAITEWATEHPGRIVFCNPAEGSQTILLQLRRLRITDYVRDGRIGLITSGDLEPGIRYCQTDCYFSNIVEYEENKLAQLTAAGNTKPRRPYEYVMLNGRLRPHRKALIDGLRNAGLLDHALWTCLGSTVEMAFTSKLETEQSEPIRTLPPQYEIERARPRLDQVPNQGFIKHALFNNTWGDAIVNPGIYTDSWYSLVTETIYDYPYTFRTEKIWKPIAMAHPFVVAANRGYLRDLRNAGFRTFGEVVDESYDLVDDAAERIQRTVAVVGEIRTQGAGAFWAETRAQCEHNQQLLVEYNRRQRAALPGALQQYLDGE